MSLTTPMARHQAATRERLRASGMTRPGPAGMSFRINREILVIGGWGRAVLLQLAHPLVAAGVDEHSGFRGGPGSRIARLRSTVGAMLSLTFGDDDEAIGIAARINTIHDRISGTLGSGAERYSAHDPELLCWVHGTLVESNLLAYETLVGPLRREERDRYCAEAAIMEPLLDIPAGLLPRNATELEAYVRDALDGGRIVVTPGSRALAEALLFPPRWRLAWPLFRPMQLMTIGLLPDSVRRAYGFRWLAQDERALARWTRALRRVRRAVPSFVREWPMSRRRRERGVGSVTGRLAKSS